MKNKILGWLGFGFDLLDSALNAEPRSKLYQARLPIAKIWLLSTLAIVLLLSTWLLLLVVIYLFLLTHLHLSLLGSGVIVLAINLLAMLLTLFGLRSAKNDVFLWQRNRFMIIIAHLSKTINQALKKLNPRD